VNQENKIMADVPFNYKLLGVDSCSVRAKDDDGEFTHEVDFKEPKVEECKVLIRWLRSTPYGRLALEDYKRGRWW
jgi:hypothetical protein